MPISELSSIALYQQLGLYPQLLYAAEYFKGMFLHDLESEFPGSSEQTLETERCRLIIGNVSQDAVRAMADLLNDGLLELSVSHAPASNPLPEGALELLESAGKTTAAQRLEIEKRVLTNQPDLQGTGCWYTDPSGRRTEVGGAYVCIVVTITESGKKLWNLMKSVRNRLQTEVVGLPNN